MDSSDGTDSDETRSTPVIPPAHEPHQTPQAIPSLDEGFASQFGLTAAQIAAAILDPDFTPSDESEDSTPTPPPVQVDPNFGAQFGITAIQIAAAINAENFTLPGEDDSLNDSSSQDTGNKQPANARRDITIADALARSGEHVGRGSAAPPKRRRVPVPEQRRVSVRATIEDSSDLRRPRQGTVAHRAGEIGVEVATSKRPKTDTEREDSDKQRRKSDSGEKDSGLDETPLCHHVYAVYVQLKKLCSSGRPRR